MYDILNRSLAGPFFNQYNIRHANDKMPFQCKAGSGSNSKTMHKK